MTIQTAPISRSNVVPSGCVLGTTMLIVAIAIAGYFGYRYYADAFNLPAELERFKTAEDVRAQVLVKTPRPPEGTRLDSAWLALYIDGLDSTGTALAHTLDLVDSLSRTSRAQGDTSITSLLTSPMFIRAVAIVAPSTRRSLVDYLNGRRRSLDEYIWAKQRIVAAAGITREHVDSALAVTIKKAFGGWDEGVSFGSDETDDWFAMVDTLRHSGTISDEERALAASFRDRILDRGFASLYGFDTEFWD